MAGKLIVYFSMWFGYHVYADKYVIPEKVTSNCTENQSRSEIQHLIDSGMEDNGVIPDGQGNYILIFDELKL